VPVCGDQMLQGDETCEDGNTTPCDGCSPTCTAEDFNFFCQCGVAVGGACSFACGEPKPAGVQTCQQALQHCLTVVCPGSTPCETSATCSVCPLGGPLCPLD
jgi:cysteine-rich repeat protein